MSLLRRIERQEEEEEDLTGDPSTIIHMSSAWSVWPEIKQHLVLRTLAENVKLSAVPRYPPGSWAVIGTDGTIYANPLRYATAHEWQFVLAHLLAHLGLRHQSPANARWTLAYELAATSLVVKLGIGAAPDHFAVPKENWPIDADTIYNDAQYRNYLSYPRWQSASGPASHDVITIDPSDPPADVWAMMLTRGLLEMNGGKGGLAPWATVSISRARQALQWFVEEFPLLSSLAAHFDVVEDRDMAAAFQIAVAAVSAERMEIIINPDAGLTPPELRFVMGHELLHVGLLHHKRKEDRDHFIWNCACDFVINAWLRDMAVGEMPRGGLFNPAFAGLSANEIYERLINDPNYVKTLVSFRGIGIGDILPQGARGQPKRAGTVLIADLADDLMKEGINKHMEKGRGLLPAELLEMVTPTYASPPDWKMSLAKWFTAHFEELSPARTYARLSRRQQSTPDIPRPRYANPQFPDGSGMFAVMLDTSGSMGTDLLSKCLGAIVSLSKKHNIKQIRLVFCDAVPYDEGFVPVKRLLEPVHVKGRGGTRLQPGVDLLEYAKDLPKNVPMLVITDGACDHLKIKREHAFLIPKGNHLPFTAEGPVFELE